MLQLPSPLPTLYHLQLQLQMTLLNLINTQLVLVRVTPYKQYCQRLASQSQKQSLELDLPVINTFFDTTVSRTDDKSPINLPGWFENQCLDKIFVYKLGVQNHQLNALCVFLIYDIELFWCRLINASDLESVIFSQSSHHITLSNSRFEHTKQIGM